ncbi:hypothetical protein Ccrd_012954 [Cynara cardunculus var. scolymus]|uniref:Uncharacterized protein n=1 Tax=Cynara cardunculus var. scolymus TaxID=59895 RepID=A0A124SH76_CYNCS|nr:hypothetical protein Ccrd_012954 [Cynara cardunculus var. scolymus]
MSFVLSIANKDLGLAVANSIEILEDFFRCNPSRCNNKRNRRERDGNASLEEILKPGVKGIVLKYIHDGIKK